MAQISIAEKAKLLMLEAGLGRKNSLIVLNSGGLGSALAAFMLRDRYEEIHCLTLEFGLPSERIKTARAVAVALNAKSHEILRLPSAFLKQSDRPSLDVPVGLSGEIADMRADEPFYPAKFQVMLSLAANRAYALGCSTVLAGITQEDLFRPEYRGDVLRLQEMLTSSAIWGGESGGISFVAPNIHTYMRDVCRAVFDHLGDRAFHEALVTHNCSLDLPGGCGECEACMARDAVFVASGIPDPAWDFRAQKNTLLRVATRLSNELGEALE